MKGKMNKIILVSGKISSGKDTVSQIIEDQLKLHDYRIFQEKFAAHLKHICSTTFQPLADELNKIFEENNLPQHITKKENWYENKTIFSRSILQIIGTEIFRNHVDQDFWVDHLARKIHETLNANFYSQNVILISDWRFLSETGIIEKINHLRLNSEDVEAILVKVERNVDLSQSQYSHVSENDLEKFKGFDVVINNKGSMEDLKIEVNKKLKQLGLI